MLFVLFQRSHKELADAERSQWCQTEATGISVYVFCLSAMALQEESDIQRNPCVRPVLCTCYKKLAAAMWGR